MIEIYSDGSSRGNPGDSVYGIVIYKNNQPIRQLYSYQGHNTNNYAEMKGFAKALQIAIQFGTKVSIFTDSKYVEGMYNNDNWNPKVYQQDWARIRSKKSNQISVGWVKSHSGNKNNDRADQLANLAIRQKKDYDSNNGPLQIDQSDQKKEIKKSKPQKRKIKQNHLPTIFDYDNADEKYGTFCFGGAKYYTFGDACFPQDCFDFNPFTGQARKNSSQQENNQSSQLNQKKYLGPGKHKTISKNRQRDEKVKYCNSCGGQVEYKQYGTCRSCYFSQKKKRNKYYD